MRGTGHHAAALREHAWLIALLAAHAVIVLAAAIIVGRFPGSFEATKACLDAMAAIILVVLLIAATRAAAKSAGSPLQGIHRWYSEWSARHRTSAIISCLALPALMSVFLLGKNLIPLIHPFAWDVPLAELDRLLHGGHPWELLQPVLGHPAITQIISRIYLLWFVLLFGAWVVWALTSHPERMRFLISYVLCWILLGNLAAAAFSSAGPVFYAEVTGDSETFGGLMSYLQAVDSQSPLPSMEIRDRLWRAYLGSTGDMASGISAMPSLHVAIVTLCAISGWYVNRLVGALMTLFAIVIFIGSIHLGWHYAVDGYASALATAAIWIAVGRLLRRRRGELPAAPAGRPAPGLVGVHRLQ
jgi:hypothetical protein